MFVTKYVVRRTISIFLFVITIIVVGAILAPDTEASYPWDPRVDINFTECLRATDFSTGQVDWLVNVSATAQNIDTNPDGIWAIVRDDREFYFLSYNGPTSYLNQMFIRSGFNQSMRSPHKPIRIKTEVIHTIELWRGSYSIGIPSLYELVAEAEFSIACPAYALYLPMAIS